MSQFFRHPYHLVDESPWPLMSAISVFFVTIGTVLWFHNGKMIVALAGTISLLLNMCQWWRDVSAEGSLQGRHLSVVELGLRWGMILFIVSEVFFFFSFFWCYFHMGLAPSVDLGSTWAPMGVMVLNPMEMPLLNTVILVVSGTSVTWAHHALMEGSHSSTKMGLMLTILLGGLFTVLQYLEYLESSFSVSESVYGSVFFISTGFHGLHVIVGSIFLSVSFYRLSKGNFSVIHHFGLEASVWYWHFVDVVWLFLYMCIYWWGSL